MGLSVDGSPSRAITPRPFMFLLAVAKRTFKKMFVRIWCHEKISEGFCVSVDHRIFDNCY